MVVVGLVTVFIRSGLLYIFAVFVTRAMGKREIGQFQPFELVLVIMIAELAATPMGDIGIPLLYGVVPMLALILLHSALALISMKNERLRAWISGRPSIVIKQGAIQEDELKRLCYNLSDLLQEARGAGVLNINDIETAILETSGKLSVFPKSAKRPATPEDLQLRVGYEGIPLTLVMDGIVQEENLCKGGLDVNWLISVIAPLGYASPQALLLCSLDTQGKMFVQGKGKQARMQLIDALAPEQVGW